MKLEEIVAWYQKKIGTYDKQQWEKSVEQRILDGFSAVTLKTAKLKTDLIDVDLVRGSTFPKAKSKQSLLTVIRLAILRYFFLPVHAQWWVTQTSANGFAVLLILYVLQMINWAIYMLHINRAATVIDKDDNTLKVNQTNTHNDTVANSQSEIIANLTTEVDDEIFISLSELLIPMGLGLLLSLIHSQIVATNTVSGIKSSKRRRHSNTGQSGKQPRGQESLRNRRRKRLVKVRNHEVTTVPTGILTNSASIRKLNVGTEMNTSASLDDSIIGDKNSSSHAPTIYFDVSSEKDTELSEQMTLLPSKPAILANSARLQLDLKHPLTSATVHTQYNTEDGIEQHATTTTTTTHKRRNVNWHSPIHNYATETMEKQQQTSPQNLSSTSSNTSDSTTVTPDTTSSAVGNDAEAIMIATDVLVANTIDTNHYTSHSKYNQSNHNEESIKISSSSSTATQHIDECVQQFYNDLLNLTDIVVETVPTLIDDLNNDTGQEESVIREETVDGAVTQRRHIGEDDGFESLNGKSSSGDETNSPMPTTSAMASNNQLRLRLHTSNQPENCATQNLLTPNSIITNNTASYRRRVPLSSESDYDKKLLVSNGVVSSSCDAYHHTMKKSQPTVVRPTSLSSEDSEEDGETISSPASVGNASNYHECTTSATEWLGVTTNSEECSYSSEMENSDHYKNNPMSDEDGCDIDFAPTTILNPNGTPADRISCAIWDHREIKKAQMSVLEISSCIIERVESMPETHNYIYIGIGFSILLSLIPSFCRLCEATMNAENSTEVSYFDVPMLLWEKASFSLLTIFGYAFGTEGWERTVLIISIFERISLTTILFIIFAVAERTFKQRFLYAKLFSHLTSSRRARKSNLPHFRLNKVRNIKTWLSVRSYLKKRGPQRSVDVIVSAAFIVTLLLLAFLSVEWLKDSVRSHSHLNLEALMWSATIGIFLLRFMTLGNKIHQKYCSVSVLITEQINLYLQIEQKPKKKDELMVANSVLKLAADLLKELETPFKISGLSANPYLFTTIKVVILSALSGVLSEMLGFKLKLHKIKIK